MEDFARAQPVLADLGQNQPHGRGRRRQTTEMINQVLVLNNYCVLPAALAPTGASGADATKIPDALGSGYAGNTTLRRFYPRLVARDFAPAGFVFQAVEDLDMLQSHAKELKVPVPMSAQTTSLFRILNAEGDGPFGPVLTLRDSKESLWQDARAAPVLPSPAPPLRRCARVPATRRSSSASAAGHREQPTSRAQDWSRS